jgi:phage terminase small subunit
VAKLTAKQQRFVDEYLVDLNATQAYLRAGYKVNENVAAVNAQRLLRNANIQHLLSQAMQERAKRTEITADRVLKEMGRLGFFDPRKLFNDDGSPKGIQELDDDTAAALAGLEVIEIWEGKGEDRHFVGYLKKYKLADKKGALDSIARHLGMFNDKLEVTGNMNNPFAGLTTEELKKLIQDA